MESYAARIQTFGMEASLDSAGSHHARWAQLYVHLDAANNAIRLDVTESVVATRRIAISGLRILCLVRGDSQKSDAVC